MKKENDAFISFSNDKHGLIFDDSNHDTFPIKYYNVIDGFGFERKDNCSYYGFVYDGTLTIQSKNRPFIELCKGMYFSVSEEFYIHKYKTGKAIIIEVYNDKGIYPETNYSATFNVGGPIEKHGRLKYIDGCTDSLLISPVKLGNPCLNHLHFPPNITQTPHTHPSHRIGIVAKGKGLCVTPFGNLELTEGMIFVIKEWNGKDYKVGVDEKEYEVGNHCFYTFDSCMDVIAFHPDSDFGPQDEFHPMINRTIVNGISAKDIDSIRTK